MRLVRLIIIVFFGFIIASCEDRYTLFNTTLVTAKHHKKGFSDTVIKDTLRNVFFSRVFTKNCGGLSVMLDIGPAHQNKKMWVVFKGNARTNYAHSNSSITLSANDANGEVLLWRAVFLRYYYTDINRWCSFKDSLQLPAAYFGKPYTRISVFPFLGDSEKENFDIDSLQVEFKEEG